METNSHAMHTAEVNPTPAGQSTGTASREPEPNMEDNMTPAPGLTQGDSIVNEALAAAQKTAELRQTAIQHLRARQEEIERNLKALGYYEEMQAVAPKPPRKEVVYHDGPRPSTSADRKRFDGMTIAEIGRILLGEKEVLVGREIERLAMAGGYATKTKNLQNYLPVAFRRAGGFENTGGNTWRLNKSVKPLR